MVGGVAIESECHTLVHNDAKLNRTDHNCLNMQCHRRCGSLSENMSLQVTAI